MCVKHEPDIAIAAATAVSAAVAHFTFVHRGGTILTSHHPRMNPPQFL
jgi:hypothetical protein